MLAHRWIFGGLFAVLRDTYGDLWTAVELHEKQLGGWGHRPGDLDFLFGPMRDGEHRFDFLLGVEMKVRRATVDGGPGRISEFGRTQAEGIVRAGCDYSLLLHLVVGPQSLEFAEHQSASGIGTLFGTRFDRARGASMKLTCSSLPPGIGYLAVEWGHPAANDPLVQGVLKLFPIIKPLRPCHERSEHWRRANSRIRSALEVIWGTQDNAVRVIRRCPRCHSIVAVVESSSKCVACDKSWIEQPIIPIANSIRKLEPEQT